MEVINLRKPSEVDPVSACTLLAVAGCRPALHLAIKRPDLVDSMMLISPGFFDGEPAEVREVFMDLRALFVEANEMVIDGRIPKKHQGRIVHSDALTGYINYTCTLPCLAARTQGEAADLLMCHLPAVGDCISEEQAEREMDKVNESVYQHPLSDRGPDSFSDTID